MKSDLQLAENLSRIIIITFFIRYVCFYGYLHDGFYLSLYLHVTLSLCVISTIKYVHVRCHITASTDKTAKT